MDLKVTTEALENRQILLTIEVGEERTRRAMERAAREIAKQVHIPGFRPGKAPYSVIVQRFGEETVRQQAAELLADEVYAEALEQEDIEPYAPGRLEDVQLHPITFRLSVPLEPKVELGNYREFRLEYPTAEVAPERVERALEQIREDNALFELVERPAQLGDGVAFDLLATLPSGEKALEGKDLRTVLQAGSTDPAPGFHEALVGMQAGEERTFTLTLGDDFPREEFRGQQAEFKVRMLGVYNYILPALDDDLARTVGSFNSLEELRQAVAEELRRAEQNRLDREYAEQVVGAIVAQASIEYPPVMLERELEELLKEYEETIKRQTRLSLEDYLKVQGLTREQLLERMKPQADARIRRGLVLREVISREQIEVSEEEIKERIEAESNRPGGRSESARAFLESEEGRRALVNRLLLNKAVERLVAIAKGEAPPQAGESAAEGSTDSAVPEAGAEAAQREEPS